ncbi:hypothetical protein K474DRAFT_1664490 [Panus rudis PR-1116 ss-1]|nr:hypothetical protein K474DRAFT_1664490 [Panus rudis PR-1116 ss-1]
MLAKALQYLQEEQLTLSSSSGVIEDTATEFDFPQKGREDEEPGRFKVPDTVGSLHLFSEQQFEMARNGVRAKRFSVQVVPVRRHFAVWDKKPTDVIVWPAVLCIVDNQPDRPGFTDRVPIRAVDVDFYSKDASVFAARLNGSLIDRATAESFGRPFSEFTVRYAGHTAKRCSILNEMGEDKGVTFERYWHMYPEGDTRKIFRAILPENTAFAAMFFVPIPITLLPYDSRFFNVQARVTFGDWDFPPSVGFSEPLEVLIECLSKEQHMDGRKLLHPKGT